MNEALILLMTVYGVAVHHLDRERALELARTMESHYVDSGESPSAAAAMAYYDGLVIR